MRRIADRLIARALKRAPDYVIGGSADPYMLRWWVIPRNRWFNVYLHQFLRSDDDRALHDHPWSNCSILLRGSYTEHTTNGAEVIKQGSIRPRLSGRFAHRIELHDGPVWTLFLTGPRYREWFFHCPNGLVHWHAFTSPADKGSIGRGCDQ